MENVKAKTFLNNVQSDLFIKATFETEKCRLSVKLAPVFGDATFLSLKKAYFSIYW